MAAAHSKNAEKLIRSCYGFVAGDLVSAMEIEDLCSEILSSRELSDEQRAIIEKVRHFFGKGMKEGFAGDFEEQLESLKTQLTGLFSAEASGADEEQQTGETSNYDAEVLNSFIQESGEHLENMEEQFLGLENNPDPVAINSIFRSMHTIKGVASFIGLHKIKDLSHSLESVLDMLRSDEISISTDLIDVLLSGVDLLNRMVSELDKKSHQILKTGVQTISLDSSFDIKPVLTVLQGVIQTAEKEEAGKGGGAQDVITPEMVSGFIAESAELIDSVGKLLDAYREDPSSKEQLSRAFRTLHTIKGNAGFLGYSAIEQVCTNLQQVLDQLQRGEQEYDDRVAAVLFESLRALKDSIVHLGVEEDLQPEALPATEAAGPSGGGTSTASDAAETYGLRPLGEALVEMGEVSKEKVDQALEKQQRKLGEILVESGYVEEELVSRALEEQQTRQGKAAEEKEQVQRTDIRVDTEKLDKLFDLMGELITAQAMVVDNPDLKQYNLEGFSTAANYLSKITREMQEITMMVRMIPLEGLFNKMRRLVRDLSRTYNKKISLEIEGQDTEMDRNIMEDISEPLIHIIQNSVEHGIESPERREQAGKDGTGTVRLEARIEGNEIWISVKDDGRGLDREAILRQAEQAGLSGVSEADKLSDTKVWAFICEPGFSAPAGSDTAAASADPEKGNGMDVVKKKVEKLRGRVDILSQKNKGTEILLRIPLTLAIIDGIIFKVADKLYSMPIGDVLSFHKAEDSQVTVTKQGQEVLNLRGDLVPIIKLYEVHGIATDKRSAEDGSIMVIFADNKKAALLVDEILDYKQLVVKALPESMSNLRGISGCSIMGNGDVSLIIDTASLVNSVIE